MRIFNRTHAPWAIFVALASVFAGWLYLGNFHSQSLPATLQLPQSLLQKASDHRSVGGTPLGLILGTIALAIFIFAALLGVRKKLVLWRVGTVQRWMRAHIWLTLLTIPLVILHSGFRLGGPMTTLLIVLYAIVMVSGVYGLALQHQMPRIMMERLPAESVYEQIPHIRAQLYAAAQKMRDSFKPAPPQKTDAGAPAPSAAKAVTAGSTPMASTAAHLSTPTARAKSVVGSTITAETIAAPIALKTSVAGVVEPSPRPPAAATTGTPATAETKAPETMGTPTARVPEGAPVPAGTQPVTGVAPPMVTPKSVTPPTPIAVSAPPVAGVADPGPRPPATAKTEAASAKGGLTTPAPTGSSPPTTTPAAPTKAASPTPAAKPLAPAAQSDTASEAALLDFLDRQIMPYLAARRGDKFRLGNARFSEDIFRFVKLRVTEAYRLRVEEIQAWCDERRMLDLQTKLHHWLHGWLFVHVPISFLLLILTMWHAFVTLFYY